MYQQNYSLAKMCFAGNEQERIPTYTHKLCFFNQSVLVNVSDTSHMYKVFCQDCKTFGGFKETSLIAIRDTDNHLHTFKSRTS